MKKSYPTIVYFFRAYFNSIALLNKNYAAKQLVKLFSTPRKRVVRKRETDILDQAKQSFFEVNGERVATYEWGSGSKTAILFHGWESNAGSIGAFVEPLLDRSYKVVAFDAPAHGNSEGKRSNLLYFKKTARLIVEQIGVPDIAIGHSLGANAIIMLAREDNIKIPKVVLISPLNRLMSVFEEFQQILSLPKGVFKRFIQKFEEQADYSFNDFYFQSIGKESPLTQVLLLHDIADQITDFNHSKEMNEAWPETQLKPISGSGHYRILWQDKTLETVQEFIDQ